MNAQFTGMRKWVELSVCVALLLASGSAQAATVLQLQPIATGVPNVTYVTNAGDGSGRLFITLQDGRIVVFDGTQVLPTPFLDIRALVSTGGERGLFSVAFHPNYAINGFFFIDYTDVNGDTVVARYSVSVNPNIANPNSAVIVLAQQQPFANHNGGQLQFGPDGFLYIGMGDGGSAGDPFNNAQNLGAILGKMLRIDVDSAVPYAIPPGNPFVGVQGARGEIWALGLRNPWRFTFDRLTGDMFIADVGQDMWEEADFQPASSLGGENYGWRFMEGNHCFNPPAACTDGTLSLPILEYSHLAGGCSITGGYRYRGVDFPEIFGIYFFADFCSGLISGAVPDGLGGWTVVPMLDTAFAITTFGEDEAGELYLGHSSPVDGTIYRVTTVSTLAAITLQAPADLSVLTSPPTFAWTPDGGTNNGFAVDLSLTTAFTPFWSTRENLRMTITATSWAMPIAVWNRIPAGRQVFWRVRGADLSQQPLSVITSGQVRSFVKQ
jgi:glucose/arabinose dehydrogenase